MAVTNTGIVLRTITGVNESDLFLDSEATSVATNTGIVERSVTGLNESVAFRQDTRTNLITHSEDFSNASWAKGGASVTSGFTSPSGDLSAFKLVEGINNGAHRVIGNALASNIYTISVFAKYNGRVLQLASTTTVAHYANFDLLNGVTGGYGSSTENATITELTNGWYRCSMTTTSNMDTPIVSAVQSTTSGWQADEQGDGTSGVYIWGAQLEEASQATSYIPTNGAAVTVDSNSTSVVNNTGIVERSLTGVNESDLWLDSESTSVVNNTGIVERPITGVNTSDALFPDNTDSTVVNISDTIIPLLTALEARATTFENREGTQNILINLQKC